MPDHLRASKSLQWLEPDWPAPKQIRAVSSLRTGGVSSGCWSSLNMGDHVGDELSLVQQNRAAFVTATEAPAEPFWLKQVHSCHIVDAATQQPDCEADATFSTQPNQVCVVMTADCWPLLLTDKRGTAVAAVHAGWRGLCDGVIEASVAAFDCDPAQLLAWRGPAISQQAFEVGDEVRESFLQKDHRAADAFIQNQNGRWMADLYRLAQLRLEVLGVTSIYGGEHCTFTNEERFFSYRRNGQTGRMASMIWIES